MSSAAASLKLERIGTGRDLFADLRIRHGIKLALSGLLALFCSQVLAVPRDSWAILTVMVLMSAQFVGAFAFKAVMRIVGTLVGALVGVWLTSDYASTPAIFLPTFFLVMALAGYNFGHIGARQAPYAYFCWDLQHWLLPPAESRIRDKPTQLTSTHTYNETTITTKTMDEVR